MSTPQQIEGRVFTIPETGAFLTVLRYDTQRDVEGCWSWHATIAVQGTLPDDADGWCMEPIERALWSVFPVQQEGSGTPGGRFADSPWIQFIGMPCRTLLVSQQGGLDV